MTMNSALPPGYEIRSLSDEEIVPLWEQEAEKIFHGRFFAVHSRDLLSEPEHEQMAKLAGNLKGRYRLNLAVYHKGIFVGWMRGVQRSPAEFEMFNSAVLPEHRRHGIYSALLRHTIETAKEAGFQLIISAHNATNDSVLIPKLRAGFVITGFELNDIIGTLVRLTYIVNPTRQKLMEVRAGQTKPDESIRKLMEI